ncbi:hypothetical protein WMY93_034003, partial [Mugilogobius chulae]
VKILQTFSDSVNHLKGQKQQTVQTQVCAALCCVLRVTRSPLGPSELRAPALSLLWGALESSSPLLRCAAAEGLARLVQNVNDSAFTVSTALHCFDRLKTSRDAASRSGLSLALGALYRHQGPISSSQHLSSCVSVLFTLSQDTTCPQVQTWALHSLSLLVDLSGGLFRLHCEPALSLVLKLLLSSPQNHPEVHLSLGRCVHSLITCLGPDLQALRFQTLSDGAAAGEDPPLELGGAWSEFTEAWPKVKCLMSLLIFVSLTEDSSRPSVSHVSPDLCVSYRRQFLVLQCLMSLLIFVSLTEDSSSSFSVSCLSDLCVSYRRQFLVLQRLMSLLIFVSLTETVSRPPVSHVSPDLCVSYRRQFLVLQCLMSFVSLTEDSSSSSSKTVSRPSVSHVSPDLCVSYRRQFLVLQCLMSLLIFVSLTEDSSSSFSKTVPRPSVSHVSPDLYVSYRRQFLVLQRLMSLLIFVSLTEDSSSSFSKTVPRPPVSHVLCVSYRRQFLVLPASHVSPDLCVSYRRQFLVLQCLMSLLIFVSYRRQFLVLQCLMSLLIFVSLTEDSSSSFSVSCLSYLVSLTEDSSRPSVSHVSFCVSYRRQFLVLQCLMSLLIFVSLTEDSSSSFSKTVSRPSVSHVSPDLCVSYRRQFLVLQCLMSLLIFVSLTEDSSSSFSVYSSCLCSLLIFVSLTEDSSSSFSSVSPDLWSLTEDSSSSSAVSCLS